MGELSHQERLARDLHRLLKAAAFVFGVALLLGLTGYGRDDTDPPGRRSGLGLYTDHRTGCQYVEGFWGGFAPRIGPDGKPVCIPDEGRR